MIILEDLTACLVFRRPHIFLKELFQICIAVRHVRMLLILFLYNLRFNYVL